MTAVNLVQGHVARLRRALGDRAGEVLRTHPPGYRLALTEGDLDADFFERLVQEGTIAIQEGNFERASATITNALGLWRGSAFADVSMSAAVELEANRLEQLRLTSLEARLNADLELGRHDLLTPELRSLVETHPLHEPFWGQLMQSLYRSGRRADSLAAYARLHEILDKELGVEPMKYIQVLRNQILSDDAAGEAPKAGHVPISTAPRQLPRDIAPFVGRAAVLAELDALIGEPHKNSGAEAAPIIVLTGPAGVGKTALAVHWAHRIAHRFPDGQLYVDLRGFSPEPALEPTRVMRDFLSCFGVSPNLASATAGGEASRYRSVLSHRQALILLDNAADVEQVRPLLPGTRGITVIVTSRNQLSGLVAIEAARSVALTSFTPEETRWFLLRRIGRDRAAAEPGAVEEIADQCTGLPLALATVAARATISPRFSLQELAGEVREQSALDTFVSSDGSVDVRASFSWSYQKLTKEAALLFRVLGSRMGIDVPEQTAADLTGLSHRAVRPLLSELRSVHLLSECAPGRYTMDRLLRAFAADLTGTSRNDVDAVHVLAGRAG